MDMSKWTHAACYDCWDQRYPNRRQPARINMADEEDCCFCGVSTQSGIYVRAEPNQAFCNHKES